MLAVTTFSAVLNFICCPSASATRNECNDHEACAINRKSITKWQNIRVRLKRLEVWCSP